MCAVPPKAEVSRVLRLLKPLDAQQNFEPFRLAEACDLPPCRRKRAACVDQVMDYGSGKGHLTWASRRNLPS